VLSAFVATDVLTDVVGNRGDSVLCLAIGVAGRTISRAILRSSKTDPERSHWSMTAVRVILGPDTLNRHSVRGVSMRSVLFCGHVALVTVAVLSQTSLTGAITRHPSAKSKLLTISEMPAGWRIDNSSSNAGGIGGTKCLAGLNKANKTPGQAEVSFDDGAGVPSVGEILGSGKKLVRAFSEIAVHLKECKTLTLKENGANVSGTIGALSFPTMGAKSWAFQITFNIKGVTAGFDLIVFAAGSYVGALIYGDIGTPEISQVEAFANLALAKVKGAPLPSISSPTTTGPTSIS
jgi:hypothetical protein